MNYYDYTRALYKEQARPHYALPDIAGPAVAYSKYKGAVKATGARLEAQRRTGERGLELGERQLGLKGQQVGLAERRLGLERQQFEWGKKQRGLARGLNVAGIGLQGLQTWSNIKARHLADERQKEIMRQQDLFLNIFANMTSPYDTYEKARLGQLPGTLTSPLSVQPKTSPMQLGITQPYKPQIGMPVYEVPKNKRGF